MEQKPIRIISPERQARLSYLSWYHLHYSPRSALSSIVDLKFDVTSWEIICICRWKRRWGNIALLPKIYDYIFNDGRGKHAQINLAKVIMPVIIIEIVSGTVINVLFLKSLEIII